VPRLANTADVALTFVQPPRRDLMRRAQLEYLRDAAAHDAFLCDVLAHNRHEVQVVTPWLSQRALDESGLVPALSAAVARGIALTVYTDRTLNAQRVAYDESAFDSLASAVETLREMGADLIEVCGVHSTCSEAEPTRTHRSLLAADRERTLLLAERDAGAEPLRLAEIETRLVEIKAQAEPSRAARILAGLGLGERDSISRSPICRAAGECASGLLPSCSPNPICCCSTSRPNHSHNRHFLNAATTLTLHLDRGRLYAGQNRGGAPPRSHGAAPGC
jgi:hypothetical protein